MSLSVWFRSHVLEFTAKAARLRTSWAQGQSPVVLLCTDSPLSLMGDCLCVLVSVAYSLNLDNAQWTVDSHNS